MHDKKSEKHTGGPCVDLDFQFLLQVSDNLNQLPLAAVVTCPEFINISVEFTLHCLYLPLVGRHRSGCGVAVI